MSPPTYIFGTGSPRQPPAHSELIAKRRAVGRVLRDEEKLSVHDIARRFNCWVAASELIERAVTGHPKFVSADPAHFAENYPARAVCLEKPSSADQLPAAIDSRVGEGQVIGAGRSCRLPRKLRLTPTPLLDEGYTWREI